ncbi:glycosyltransferase family 2 protein [Coleophoma cylindrospora]|uniref:Glycosyltransferase family 2 protein n=1 Tax=Coleophoma cylindrospora TaxID=1849047 RepID=A0A3D8QLL7_9HELO|nr:glycosyltransferase family 2 protein [Coleophoma cylindrospora]
MASILHSDDGFLPEGKPPGRSSLTSGKMFQDLYWFFKTTSDGVQDWTPFLMVLSYFAFSICIYMVADSGAMKVFWFVYLWTNTYIAGATVIEAMLSVGPSHDAKMAVAKVAKKGWVFPTPDSDLLKLDIIIVAYLPNEQDIILDRVDYLLNKVVYPRDKLCVTVLYNTPVPIEPLETQLHEMSKGNPNLRVIKVPNSKSKADNINYYCTLNTGCDVSAIYDCDHYPHPYGPRWAMERFAQDPETDIVQGRCIIFNADATLMTAMIAVEFDKIYAVSHPGRTAMFGFGLFCGSNGYWRTPLLKKLKMDETMLTEDIDSALRAFGAGAKVAHDLNVTSFELAPTTMSALWKQRLRWSQGWIQASIRHVHLVWTKSEVEGKHRNGTMRFGLLSLLLIRELSYYLVTQYLCLVVSIVIMNFPQSGSDLLKLVFFQYPVAWWLFMLSVISMIATLYITFHTRSEFVRWWMIPIFTVTYPIQLVFMAVMGLFGHARQVSKYVKWNPTPRT